MSCKKSKIGSRLVVFFAILFSISRSKFWRGLLHICIIIVSHMVCVCAVYPSLIFTLLCGCESYPFARASERTFCINEVYLYKLNIPFCSNTFIRHTRARTRTHSVPIHWNRAIYFIILCVPFTSTTLTLTLIETRYIAYTQCTWHYRSYNLLSCWIYNKYNM